MRWLIVALMVLAAPAAAQQIVFAGGHWAAIDRGATCEAGSRALRIAAKGKIQARAGFAFDAAGSRHGQFFALLSRVPRSGSTIVLTVGDQPFMLASGGQWAWSTGPGGLVWSARSTRVSGRAGRCSKRRFRRRWNVMPLHGG